MAKIVFGLFDNRADAEEAIGNLERLGYNPKDISVIMRQSEEAERVRRDTGASVTSSVATGATTGGAIGALAGLLIGVGAIAIPGIGAILIGGPIAAALGLTGAAATTVSGAVTGALAGGLIGALRELGVPEEEARVYQDRVSRGSVLLAVPVGDDHQQEAENIMAENDATNIRSVEMTPEYRRGLHTKLRE